MARVKAVHSIRKGKKEIRPGEQFDSSGDELEYLRKVGAVVPADEPAPFVDVAADQGADDEKKPTRKKPGPKPGAKKTGAKKTPAKKAAAKDGESGKDSKPADTKESDDDLTG